MQIRLFLIDCIQFLKQQVGYPHFQDRPRIHCRFLRRSVASCSSYLGEEKSHEGVRDSHSYLPLLGQLRLAADWRLRTPWEQSALEFVLEDLKSEDEGSRCSKVVGDIPPGIREGETAG